MADAWGYKYLIRRRFVEAPGMQTAKVTPWEVFEGEKQHGQTDIFEIANKFGSEGWELVSVTPRSSLVDLLNKSLAGITSEELWVFKRKM